MTMIVFILKELYFKKQLLEEITVTIVRLHWHFAGPQLNASAALNVSCHCIAQYESVLTCSYLARHLPSQLVLDLFGQYQRFVVCCSLLY